MRKLIILLEVFKVLIFTIEYNKFITLNLNMKKYIFILIVAVLFMNQKVCTANQNKTNSEKTKIEILDEINVWIIY